MRELVDQMLALVEPDTYRIDDGSSSFRVLIGGITADFGDVTPSDDRQLEQLAAGIERCIAYDRARAMLAAVGVAAAPLPLWLVTGSSVLAAWLAWSHTELVFRRRLALSDHLGAAPVSGVFERRARQALGHAAVKVRVRNGLAVAERIELPGRMRCTAMFGREAQIRFDGGPLPETIITALAENSFQNDRRRIAEVVDHQFFTFSDLRLVGIRNDGNTVVMDIESQWGPLAPLPGEAWRAVPQDADPTSPWRATSSEVAKLYSLVDAGRHHAIEA